MTEAQKEFDCIYYPMCHWAYELLYCPKKARGDKCDDYVSAKSDAMLDELWRFCLDNGVETREGLIGYRGEDGFLLLKILKKIAELRSQQKERE